jgi:hypothetical protein
MRLCNLVNVSNGSDGIDVAQLLSGAHEAKGGIKVIRKTLIAFALLGVAAFPAGAVAPPGMRWMITHGGGRIAATPVNGDAASGDRFDGEIIAVDPQHGSFLLGTDARRIALRADPTDLAELQVGQTLEVAVVDATEPSASPKLNGKVACDAEGGKWNDLTRRCDPDY